MKLKRLLFTVVYLIGLLVLVEATGHLAYRITQGQWFSSSELKQQRLTLLEKHALRDKALADEAHQDPNAGGAWSVQIVHPYMGYVVDFHEDACGTIGFCNDRIRRYGKEHPGQHFVPKTDGNLIVAITGGSFANGVGAGSTPGKWEEALATIPAFADKKIYIYTLALGGFKQPQQLNAMSFFLGMGAEFDMIINVDGFNEVALPVSENRGWKINPFFPRFWSRLAGWSKVDARIRRLEGEVSFYQGRQADLARQFQTGWYRNSALANMLWISGNQKLKAKTGQLQVDLLEQGNRKDRVLTSKLESRGPTFKSRDYEVYLESSVAFWVKSSESLNAIANVYDVPYFHFLQPNQYVKGSKIFTEEERKLAIKLEGNGYARAATAGYPLLIEAGKKLVDRQVNFTDLTQMFANNSEVLYKDSCCHVNTRGYDYVVDEIVKVLAESF